ncbi:hypothetical protein JF66_03565 [Cryobacterium sp. MLB-32]|nr:hypothetical protein JF66_03565 [Cryobacterium sp. MLB-32]
MMLGFILGVMMFLLVLAPQSDGAAYARGWDAVRSAISYGVVGLIVAAAAWVGGCSAVALRDHRLKREPGARAAAAAVGAAAGTVVLVVVFVVVISGATPNSAPGFYPGFVGLAFVLAVISSIAAAALVHYAEKPRRAGRVKSSPPIRESRWTTF